MLTNVFLSFGFILELSGVAEMRKEFMQLYAPVQEVEGHLTNLVQMSPDGSDIYVAVKAMLAMVRNIEPFIHGLSISKGVVGVPYKVPFASADVGPAPPGMHHPPPSATFVPTRDEEEDGEHVTPRKQHKRRRLEEEDTATRQELDKQAANKERLSRKPQQCYCGYLCRTYASYQKHLEKHAPGEAVNCSKKNCGKSYRGKELYVALRACWKHFRQVHEERYLYACKDREIITVNEEGEEVGRYQCTYKTDEYPLYMSHLKREHGEGTSAVLCPKCHQTFASWERQKLHTKYCGVTTPKLFKCEIEGCTKKQGYTTKAALLRHVKQDHTGERPKKGPCVLCLPEYTKYFVNNSSLNLHYRTFHGMDPPSQGTEV